jgi:hypothetical protein
MPGGTRDVLRMGIHEGPGLSHGRQPAADADGWFRACFNQRGV